MADEIIGVKLQVNGGAEVSKTVKSFKAELREAKEELIKIQQTFGDISPEAQAAAKKVAEMKDALKDANEVASLFDPEKKFQAIVGVTQGIASGFAAVQGAMALVGAESGDVEKALLKVQAAMALAQGLSGIKASVEDFQRLGGVLANIGIVQKANALANTLAAGTMRLFGAATTATGTAFNFLKTAIVSTGIGALVVGIGVLINKLSEFTSATNDAAGAQRALNKEITDAANKNASEIADIYEKDKQLQIAKAKARGASEAEIVAITRKANEQITRELRVSYLQQLGDGLDAAEAKKALDKSETDSQMFELGLQQKAREESEAASKTASDKATSASKAAAQKAADERKTNAEAAKQAAQQTADELFAIQQTAEEVELRELSFKFSERLALYQKAGLDTAALLTAWETEQSAITARFAAERQAVADTANTAIIDKAIADQDAQTEREAAHAEARKQLAEQEANAKINAAQGVANALNGFAALAGEQTAAGKAFAVTSATIQAILGAQQAFTAMSVIPIVGPALGAIAAAGAIAAGIANVKKILAVPVPGKGSGGGSAPSMSAGGSAPLAPQGPQVQAVQLNQQSINSMGNATVKAIVVESDVTTMQQRVMRIQQAAKFK